MTDKGDPFKDLTFSGAPSEYRLFRRKILLQIAALEEKYIRLAGPRILSRLTGEAWKATEHLQISELRTEKGWLRVLTALDQHYRFLPETELNECVDEFLFHVKRRQGEGPTAFVSRFKTALSRLENLVAADMESQKPPGKRRRKDKPQASSSCSSSAASEDDGQVSEELTRERVERAAASAAAAAEGAVPAADSRDDSKGLKTKTLGSFVAESSPKSKKHPSSRGSKPSGRGTLKADEERAQRKMLEQLGQLEAGHLKKRAIFPSVVLGHLFMKKYGLSREQRSQVVRSTGGSCRFEDVERVLRASDFEDRYDHRGHSKPARKDAIMATENVSDTMSEPSLEASSAEAHELAEDGMTDDDEVRESLEEAFEIQKKAKANVKKHFRSYKESRKRIQEIRKGRQPYYPVVALPPGSEPTASSTVPVQPTFKYDKKRVVAKEKDKQRTKREQVSLVQTATLTEFSYMVQVETGDSEQEDFEILQASIPSGMGVIDTGCTTSVVGEQTADRYAEHFQQCGMPRPELVSLPPVQLKGFNGLRSSTKRAYRAAVGQHHGVQLLSCCRDVF